MRRPIRVLLAAIVAAGALAACGSPFPDASLVQRLRILGVKAEPPEADPAATIELSALVADPAGGGRPIAGEFAACAVGIDIQAEDIPCPGAQGLTLPGDGLTAALSLPEVAAWLSEHGLPLDPAVVPTDTVTLVVGLRVTAGAETLQAVKRITVRLRGDAEPNQNPVLTGITADGQDFEAPLSLAPGAKSELFPLTAPGSRQSYVPAGQTAAVLEDNTFSWFVTAGELRDGRTEDGQDAQGNLLQGNEYTAPAEPGPVTLWLLLRDNRDGEDWLTRTIQVEGAPL